MNLNSKFSKVYLRLIYQNIKRYQPTKQISFFDLKKAYSNAIRINDLDKLNLIYDPANIIQQMAGTFGHQDKLVLELKKQKNGTQINKNFLQIYLNKNWKYYQLFCRKSKITPFYIFQIDFQSKKQIYDLFHPFLKRPNNLSLQEKQNLQNQNVQDFYLFCSNCQGIYLPFDKNLKFVILNKNYTDITLLHQLTHYFQDQLNIDKVNKIDLSRINLNSINFLHLEEQSITYLFSKKEFIPHINDFCYQIEEIYLKEFNYLDKKEYLNQIINLVKSDKDPFLEWFGIIYQHYFSDNSAPFITFILSVRLSILKTKSIKILKNYFLNTKNA